MRRIKKNIEPSDFSIWKALHPDAKYKDLRDDVAFPGATAARMALRASLLAEQGGLCCYCEKRITSGDFHIEHFRPKGTGLFPHLQLEYTNLHASCSAIPSGSADEHCGHKKSDVFRESLISPLEPNCATHFTYDVTGGLKGVDSRGNETVSILNLNSALLRRSRKGVIEFFEGLSESELEGEIRIHLNASAFPLAEFYTMIEFLSAHKMLVPTS